MYQMISYMDKAQVKALYEAAKGLRLDESNQGYGSTSDRPREVEETLRPLLGSMFPNPWSYVMVVSVKTNGTLPPHADGALTAGTTRYHVVLQTNPLAWCLHDEVWQQLAQGGIYTMDCSKVHAAVNWGPEPRVHLVIDTKESKS